MKILRLSTVLCAAPFLPLVAPAHEHVFVNAASTAQGSPLSFANGAGYATNANYVFTLNFASSGTYAGYFESGGLTFASYGIFNFTPPASGAQVRLRFVSVTGPAGGSFGVWDVDGFNEDENDSTALTFSLPVGTTNGTSSILLSENNGEPGADPGGHIHGRHYSATKPGLYVVTVQAYDGAHNGTGGGPIHSASAPLPIYFHAGDGITALQTDATETRLTFPAKLAADYYIESATNLVPATAWQTAGGPVSGDDHLQTFSEPNDGSPQKFYRLRLEPTP